MQDTHKSRVCVVFSVFFYNPVYIISSEPWLICFYTWSYQWPASIEICARCWLLDRCAGRYLISWTQNELPVSFQKDKWRRVAFFTVNYKRALCRRAAWLTRRETNKCPKWQLDAETMFLQCCLCFHWNMRMKKTKVSSTCKNSGSLLHKLMCFDTRRPHRCMSRASSDSSSLVVTGTMKSCCKAPTRPVTRSDR